MNTDRSRVASDDVKINERPFPVKQLAATVQDTPIDSHSWTRPNFQIDALNASADTNASVEVHTDSTEEGGLRSSRERPFRRSKSPLIDYTVGHACRWETVIRYFDTDEMPDDRCGHSDNCVPERFV